MIEVIAALSWFELTAAGLSILVVIGGVMKRAFLTPVQDDVDELRDELDKQSQRLRTVENTQAKHGVEISTVKDVALKLVDRMDKLLEALSHKQ